MYPSVHLMLSDCSLPDIYSCMLGSGSLQVCAERGNGAEESLQAVPSADNIIAPDIVVASNRNPLSISWPNWGEFLSLTPGLPQPQLQMQRLIRAPVGFWHGGCRYDKMISFGGTAARVVITYSSITGEAWPLFINDFCCRALVSVFLTGYVCRQCLRWCVGADEVNAVTVTSAVVLGTLL